MNTEDNATNRYVSDNNLKGTMYNADANVESTKISVAGNKEIAKMNAGANSYKGGGSSGNYNSNNSGDLEFDEAWQKGVKLANTSGKYYEALALANQLSPLLGMEGWEIMRKWNPNFGKKDSDKTPKQENHSTTTKQDKHTVISSGLKNNSPLK